YTRTSMYSRVLPIVAYLFACGMALAQVSAPVAASSTTPSSTSELDTYVKIVGAIITGIATLLGLPIVFLTYKKTRAEITKLELEASDLKEKHAPRTEKSKDEGGATRIVVDQSPNTNIQILADPRFLAPVRLQKRDCLDDQFN